MNLSSEGVEVIGSIGAVDYLNVTSPHLILISRGLIFITDVIRKIQNPLDSGLTVLRSLTVHAVRENHHDSGLNSPLGLSTHDKVVDHDLSSVHEVSKLSFPDDQRVGVGN